MNFKNIIILTGFLLPVSSAFAQYAEDALRFSQTDQGATARLRGLGGAQTAVGGDLSSMAANPAGIGLFTKSEFSFTPGFSNANLNAQYTGTSSSFQRDKGGIDQAGFVIHTPARKRGSAPQWVAYNFGIAFNRTNTFNNTTDYSGRNTTSSFGDFLADRRADGDPLGVQAYNAYLLALHSGSDYFPLSGTNNNQRNTVYRNGAQSEINFSVGGNYDNKLYAGFSLGLASLKLNVDREFTETGVNYTEAELRAANLNLNDAATDLFGAGYLLDYTSAQQTSGFGVNAKLGAIYRINKNVRIGASFISPTWYTVDDSFTEGLGVTYNKNDNSTERFAPTDETYDLSYVLRTPYRVNGGLAVTLQNMLLLSGDVEYIDYASTNFRSNGDNSVTTSTNAAIRDSYQSAVNFRAGAEARLHPNFLIRGGYNKSGNPYRNAEYSSETISGGLGYRTGNFFLDLTVSGVATRYQDMPYSISNLYLFYQDTGAGESASVQNNTTNVFATIGFRF
jgi:hypothetical protein